MVDVTQQPQQLAREEEHGDLSHEALDAHVETQEQGDPGARTSLRYY